MILGFSKKAVILVGAVIAVIIILSLNNDKQASSAPATGCRVSVTADVLNARETPDSGAKVVGRYLRDAQVDALPGVQNGFRKTTEAKWLAAEFTQPVAGSAC